MYKMHTLIAGVATLGFMMLSAGCATTPPPPDVYLPNSVLSFKVRKDTTETTVKFISIDGCMYYFDAEMPEAKKSCPTVARLHNTKNDTTFQIMAFPVPFEMFLNDMALQQSLEQYFDEPFRTQGDPVQGPLLTHPNIVMRDLTWPKDKRGVWKERVVVFRVIGKNGKKEHTVFMVGHWSAQFDQEMLGVQDWMIVDIGKSNK